MLGYELIFKQDRERRKQELCSFRRMLLTIQHLNY